MWLDECGWCPAKVKSRDRANLIAIKTNNSPSQHIHHIDHHQPTPRAAHGILSEHSPWSSMDQPGILSSAQPRSKRKALNDCVDPSLQRPRQRQRQRRNPNPNPDPPTATSRPEPCCHAQSTPFFDSPAAAVCLSRQLRGPLSNSNSLIATLRPARFHDGTHPTA